MHDLESKHFAGGGGAITDIDLDVRRARSRLAEDSKAQVSRAQDTTGDDQRQKKNQELKKRFASTGGQTDDNIMDEEAGKARVRLAKESKARREWEATQEKRMNRQFRKTLQNEEAVVDDDIMDEEAGRARARLANESRRRRLEERKRIARENRELRARLQATRARTDNDITDDDQPDGKVLPFASKQTTLASLHSQWRPGDSAAPQQFRKSYRLDGHGGDFGQHISDFERRVASRGEEEFAKFAWDEWVSTDHSLSPAERMAKLRDPSVFGVGLGVLPPPALAPPTNKKIPPPPHSKRFHDWGNPPPPSTRTHTKKFVDAYTKNILKRQQQMSTRVQVRV